ncbi:MAG TPA: phosphate acyltransferase PlsX [Thermoleophilaceae bacterium]|nr:phosphate acyltransferase PlsX [Thermoleophilaceae bacterium]
MIALDANGADRGTAAVVDGARRAGVATTLYGPAAELEGAGIPFEDAPGRISNDEEPVRAVRSRSDASVVRAAIAVAEGRADAVVSAGSTGAMLAACTLHVKRLRGVHRPAIAVLLPLPGKPVMLLDVGASVEARPEHLVQFAHMGAAFMEAVHGVARPSVGLLNIGEERGKGRPEVVEAHARLAAGSGLEFVGNVEGTDLTAGAADVVVADGYTGNVALKLMEGTARTVVGAIREAIRGGAVSSVGGLLIRGRLSGLRRDLDPDTTGGAILLGLRGVAVVAHGSSGPEGIANAVRLARRAVDERMIERTSEALAGAGVLRSAPAGSVERGHG